MMLGSREEFRVYLLKYAKRIGAEGMRGKVEELLRGLMGELGEDEEEEDGGEGGGKEGGGGKGRRREGEREWEREGIGIGGIRGRRYVGGREGS